MSDDIMRALGRIEGRLDGIEDWQKEKGAKIDSIDQRTNKLEIKAALNGAVSGGVVSVGIALITAGIKEAFKV